MSTENSYSKFMDKLQDTATDFASLTVTTMTGDIKAVLDTDNDGNPVKPTKLDWKDIYHAAATNAEGTLTIEAIDHYEVDGDAFLYRRDGAINQDVAKAHKEAVDAGKALRAGVVDLFADGIKALTKK